MSSADRKIVHDVLSEFDGVTTSSAGEDPNRRVVISPANA
jgi:spoIIIJ-associated protein